MFILVLLLQACSSPQPKNSWQYQATTSLNNYTKHFLEGNTLRAKADLSHARKKASHSANLGTLIDIELTACAMQLSVLKSYPCQNASDLLVLEPSSPKQAYLDLMQGKLTTQQIEHLPSQYQDFALAYVENDISALNKTVSKIKPLTSRILASALIKDKIDAENVAQLIDTLSYYGYKAPLLSWMKHQMNHEEDKQKKMKIKAKIEVLNSH